MSSLVSSHTHIDSLAFIFPLVLTVIHMYDSFQNVHGVYFNHNFGVQYDLFHYTEYYILFTSEAWRKTVEAVKIPSQD